MDAQPEPVANPTGCGDIGRHSKTPEGTGSGEEHWEVTQVNNTGPSHKYTREHTAYKHTQGPITDKTQVDTEKKKRAGKSNNGRIMESKT